MRVRRIVDEFGIFYRERPVFSLSYSTWKQNYACRAWTFGCSENVPADIDKTLVQCYVYEGL